MFTIEQIKAAHSKVKSGADFPSYVKEIKALGVKFYEHFVADGHIQYVGADGFTILAAAKWQPIKIEEIQSIEKLQHALKIHQKGETDYLTFCKQSAEAGVEKWVLDISKMTCGYYDNVGNEMLVEVVPTP